MKLPKMLPAQNGAYLNATVACLTRRKVEKLQLDQVPEERAHWPEDVRTQKKPQDWCGTPKLLPELQNLTQFLARVKLASAGSEQQGF
ncbi:unnamed protein product, partial [Symbiodinium microadriaticum]